MELIITELNVVDDRTNLVGLKVNVSDLTETLGITEILNLLKKHIDNDMYVVGYDTLFVDKPHYHIHFRSKSDPKQLTNWKQKNLKLGRACKLYHAKEYKSNDDNVWYGYAVKENIIEIGKNIDFDAVEVSRKVQMEIKTLKNHHTQKEKYKQEEKITFRNTLFKYIDENVKNNIIENQWGVFLVEFKPVVITIIQYGKENDRFFIKAHLERYAIQYLHFRNYFTDEQLFSYYFH